MIFLKIIPNILHNNDMTLSTSFINIHTVKIRIIFKIHIKIFTRNINKLNIKGDKIVIIKGYLTRSILFSSTRQSYEKIDEGDVFM